MFYCTIVELAKAVVVHLHGEVDLATAVSLRGYLEEAARFEKPIMLEMTDLQYFDTSGARVIEAFHGFGPEERWEIFIVAPPPAVRRSLQLMGVDRQIPIFVSLEEALDHLPDVPPGQGHKPGGSRTAL